MTTISSDALPDTTGTTDSSDANETSGPTASTAGCGGCCEAHTAVTRDARGAADEAGVTGSNRRELFRRASMVAIAGGGAVALAACGGTSDTSSGGASSAGGGDTGSSSPTSAGSSPSSETSSSSSSSASGKATKSPGTKPSGTEFAKSDVPVGGGVIKDKLVVTQPTAGEFKAFSAVCTHQGCLVAQIQNGLIICPCHRSEFSIKDGSVSRGPAPSPLPAKTVTASGSDVFVS